MQRTTNEEEGRQQYANRQRRKTAPGDLTCCVRLVDSLGQPLTLL